MKMKIFGAELKQVPQLSMYPACLYSKEAQADTGFTPAWALALCTDGVTWGRLEDTGWVMGDTHYKDLCPRVTLENLLELRIFGKNGELLLWREDSRLSGRILIDQDSSELHYPPLKEKHILLGEPTGDYRGSFSRMRNKAGCEQALPLIIKNGARCRLIIKHYMTQDAETGAVRITASRLSGLEVDTNARA